MTGYGSSDDAHRVLARAIDSAVEELALANTDAGLAPSARAAAPADPVAITVDDYVAEICSELPRLVLELRTFSSLTYAVGLSYSNLEDALQNGFSSLTESALYLLGVLSRPLLLAALGAGLLFGPSLFLLNQLTQNPTVRSMLELMLAPVQGQLETLLQNLQNAYGPYLEQLLLDPTVLDMLGYGTRGIDDFLAGLLGAIPLSSMSDQDAVTLLTMLILPLLANGHKLGSDPVTPREMTHEESFPEEPSEPVTTYSEGFEQITSQDSDIVILTFELSDGSLHHQVFVQGTQDWSFGDGDSGFDSISNVENAASHQNLYGSAQGLEQALLDAGIDPNDSIDLFGYSQGGAAVALVAANGNFNISSLTTYGAPSGLIVVPEEIDWVQLQNDQDIVANVAGMSQHETNATVIEMSPDINPQSIGDPHLPPAYRQAIDELEDSGDTVSLGQIQRREERLDGAVVVNRRAYELDR